MANSKCSSGFRSLMYSGKHALLPPKSPYPSVSPACVDYVANPNPAIASKVTQKPKNGNPHHQRTSSESLILEEQPSWLDDLLNEPETPVRKGGHRRSSSDSFAYLEPSDFSNSSYADLDDYRHKNLISIPSWASQDFDHGKDARLVPMYTEMKSSKPRNRTWESSLNSATHAGGVPSGRDNAAFQSSGSSSTKETDGVPSTTNERHDPIESGTQETKVLSDRRDGSHARPSPSETDTKRAKQQFAQRSRVRKLQYIAELESNVQALQAEGSEVSAELEFLNQQHLILSMENKALKQRLESVAQEQLIKYLEQEMLEREIGRLRSMYQQQQQLQPQPPQQQQKPSASHRRTNSRDLESQFSNLSLKHKDANSGHDPMTGPLGI